MDYNVFKSEYDYIMSPENTSALTPVNKAPSLIDSVKRVDNTEYQQVEMVKSVNESVTDEPTESNSFDEFSDDYLSSQVQAVKHTLSNPKLQNALREMGVSFNPQDLTYERVKTALALFGAYKVLTNRLLGKFTLVAGAGLAYLAFSSRRRVRNKVELLAQNVNGEDVEAMGSFGYVCNRKSGGFR